MIIYGGDFQQGFKKYWAYVSEKTNKFSVKCAGLW